MRVQIPLPAHFIGVKMREDSDVRYRLTQALSLIETVIFDGYPKELEKFDRIVDCVNKELKKLCEKQGHYVISDHCGKPEHNFCMYCHALCPGQATNG